ncbi:MAG: gamma-glutamylcyclotransferase [candidate division KSB1 bacterium]|nr:gamma-glutamylcyclotransferase [candidate division KSB1 bacterium]MDZ7303181.1 gamma-glutamylcyclotransferase [candidate division KSB1 bacterium]MDZ7310160.1 gamma-glutamylcyclotransferase [candidate division KSB1 bacterium]
MDSFEPHNVLFVYDVLMRGQERAGFLSSEKTRFLGPASVPGKLYAIGDFTGLVIDAPSVNSVHNGASEINSEKKPQHDDSKRVQGELFEIFDPVTFFDTLDVIEGYWRDQAERSLFVRKLISVETENGKTMAWAYLLNFPVNDWPRFDPDE